MEGNIEKQLEEVQPGATQLLFEVFSEIVEEYPVNEDIQIMNIDTLVSFIQPRVIAKFDNNKSTPILKILLTPHKVPLIEHYTYPGLNSIALAHSQIKVFKNISGTVTGIGRQA